MATEVTDLVIEILRKIQADIGESKRRDTEIISRLSLIEEGIARIARQETSNYSEIIHDRHAVDSLREGIERIEQRLVKNIQN